MPPKQRKGKEEEAKGSQTQQEGENEGGIPEYPPYSLFGRQYLGLNLGILGSILVVSGHVQEVLPPFAFVGTGFVIVLIALFFHEFRPYQRRGYGNITDEFKQGLKEAEERENTKKTKKKD
jgi:hypothetical protein